ncbi:bcl-2/adenovirus E1B 19 kDa-interacting protein 2-like protein isoform X3 [Haplochromis burtoni]|uniref:bcl-2/adenovirus E1B 19 kDa-interacting protein 2-like protein isoform X3 n=1 Tax=Haplochromis burtoni TaxID=8153 RepID=UPI001C2D9473|nr:bcl-2/adenovirus E1B 19 kDa-interacting protein 2-like protein isoform X3 [Haplochromis burtoni]
MSSPTEHTDGHGEDRSAPGPSSPANIQDMELREEWQDDGFPRPLPEDDTESPAGESAPVTSLTLSGGGGAKKRLVAPSLSLTLNRRDSNDRNSFSAAALSGTPDDTPSLDINLEALETPSDSETGTLPDSMHDLEWDDDLPRMGRGGAVGVARNPMEQSEGLMELDQVDSRGRRWRRFCISGHEYHVNMSVLEPYLQVLSHGGQRSHTHQTTCNTPAGASRLLWRRDERHHPLHFLLPAGEHSGKLRVCHGKPVQVHCGDAGPDGLRELPASLPVRHGSQK